MKVVINQDFGGFSLSDAAFEKYLLVKGLPFKKVPGKYNSYFYENNSDSTDTPEMYWENDIPRNDPLLVEIVEELGENASGPYASLKVVEIPDDVEWEISEYDGREHIAEKHRTWS